MATPTTPQTTSYSSSQAPTRPNVGKQGTGAPRARQRKISDYGRQLSEKQKARREYGLKEAQFRRYFAAAMRSKIATGQSLLLALESRVDNVLYRAGLAKTRRMARQMVTHGLVSINDKRIDVPGFALKAGDVASVKEKFAVEYNKDIVIPDWLIVDAKKQSVKVERLPKADDLVSDINTQLIIEFYSR
jgi:small subunit ribosomal protein S4